MRIMDKNNEMELEKLKQEEKEITELLSENLDKQRELNKIAFTQKHGVDVGDTVEWIDGKTPHKGIIAEIEFNRVTPKHFIAKLFNSDGKIGKREIRIWSYSFDSLKRVSK